jgi:hypothetical protein
MIRFEEMAYIAAIDFGRMGERWQASAAGARIPAPHAAASMLRSAWCKADRHGPFGGMHRCLPYPVPRSR